MNAGTPPRSSGAPLTYRDSGVDIDAGDAFVRALAPLARRTSRPGVRGGLGGFGGMFDLREAGYVDPLLVAATDGVGTKLLLAIETGGAGGIGIDLVAMCANDVLCHGAEPLLFLDYLATGRLSADAALELAQGISRGCCEAGCALIGGETAEMPGLYAPGHYDLAGFALGAVERGLCLPARERMCAGDVLIGLASSGVHANGFSLIRRILADRGERLDVAAPFEPGRTFGEALLTPTRIYARNVLPVCRDGLLKGLAHITGGGLVANLARLLPSGLNARTDRTAVPVQPVFDWLRSAGPVAEEEMWTIFNMGVGMVLIAAAADADAVIGRMEAAGETVFVVGELVRGAA